MASSLVIVESPAKVKTIKKYLGSGYEVVASNGHVRDLPKSSMGLILKMTLNQVYYDSWKGRDFGQLAKGGKKADKIYLATDPDREGEAISWHLSKALKLSEERKKNLYALVLMKLQKMRLKRHQTSKGIGYESCRCTAGQACT